MSHLFCNRFGWGTFSSEHDNIIGKRKVKGLGKNALEMARGFTIDVWASCLKSFRAVGFYWERREDSD
jgi:hypothetical protein